MWKVTRAKKRLFLSSSRGKIIGTNMHKEISQFLDEMGALIQVIKFYYKINLIMYQPMMIQKRFLRTQKLLLVILFHI
ncbi:hypothetical protein [Mycoplasmopsis cynos]|uniref:hypothetical protein n=1 Tax=Mycoplasmopsis cynos TaxID=171284 RepID=UPI002204E44D|nr:hypothetical protein [Mycoplasmopsis cynos]UWV92201.1 hypothetical protein NWE57_04800 [Mycoplasmopsis cynos]